MSYILTHKEVTTRKSHRCFGCRRIFPSGRKMVRETVKDDIIFTTYLCSTCQYISANELEYGDEYCEGDLYERAMEIEAEQALKGAQHEE